MANSNLTNAKKAKNDEFYTQFGDIQKEIEAYLEYDKNVFRKKVVYCNCDDPFESNFFRYFVLNFNKLGLKKLITTSYIPSPIAGGQLPLFEIEGLKPEGKEPFRIEINEVKDFNLDGAIGLADIEWLLRHDANIAKPLNGNGDFRSDECVDLLKQSDIVVTNPPFSLFREYVKQLFDYGKQFVIIGNMNAITYKETFPLIKENKMWLGNGFHAGNAFFSTPFAKEYGEGVYMPETGLVKFRNCCWFTNLDHGRRHQPLPLMTMEENLKYSKHKEIKGKKLYEKYDNYNAIEVPFTDSIPSDYFDVMGVPLSFLDKYSPEQFEIIGGTANGQVPDKFKIGNFKVYNNPISNSRKIYQRILIRHKKK